MGTESSSIDAQVEMAAMELVHRHSLDEVEGALVEAGLTPGFAAKVVLLVPSAFAAEHFGPRGISFPDEFLVGPPAALRTLRYDAELGYKEARCLARRWADEGRHSHVARILDWSAEAQAIDKAIDQGLTPTRMSTIHHGDTW